MAPSQLPVNSTNLTRPRKRKIFANSSTPSNNDGGGRGRDSKRIKMKHTIDFRHIFTEPSDPAMKNGELDVQSFLKSREFEIKALQDGMQRSKHARAERAFQQVPRDMRRRTASHNVKKVPKRLRQRAMREMKDDNTPTVTRGKRKPGSSRGRVRAETAKRLRLLAAKKRATKPRNGDTGIETRPARPKIRKDKLNAPPKPKSRFRKRQIHKTWLPTHMWHAKRAKITEPKSPLWRFAIPITPTEKSYRPTRRASGIRGAVAWDMSYMSTIRLEGPANSLEKVLSSIGVAERGLWESKGVKWRSGNRSWHGYLSREVEEESIIIGPATVFWCPSKCDEENNESIDEPQKPSLGRVFIRFHPAIFLEVWAELLRLSKLQRPAVHLEDLRFEIGSINITGPNSTEALLGILHPYEQPGKYDRHADAFKSLAGITNVASMPTNSLLSFPILDPRLHYPPRPVKLTKPDDEVANLALLELLSSWPVDTSTGSPALFDREARFQATRLPSQKSLNRRKALAPPGQYASTKPTDPPIPIILLTSRITPSRDAQGTWTLLAPWKCILPIWYGLMHYPLSTGGNPRFGGLQELRQTQFESGLPSFPVDYPGTEAGFAWEVDARIRRKGEWDKRPKGKRTEWSSLDLGAGRKGEVGCGWACDFEKIIELESASDGDTTMDITIDETQKSSKPQPSEIKPTLQFLPKAKFTKLLSSSDSEVPSLYALGIVLITFTSRGVATPCARIYRLPRSSSSTAASTASQSTTREEWLSLLPSSSKYKPTSSRKSRAASKSQGRLPLNVPLPQRVRLLAQSLVQDPASLVEEGDGHPLVPGENDLIGFVTTGEFNLAEGKGTAIGSVMVTKVLKGLRGEKKGEGRFCIVRNAGEKVGRLARWEEI